MTARATGRKGGAHPRSDVTAPHQSKEERDAMRHAAVEPGLNGGYDALDAVLRRAA